MEKLHELAEAIVRFEGTESERFGLQFGLYPLWAVEKARRILAEQGQAREEEAELAEGESSAI